jgi:hypothetical protein
VVVFGEHGHGRGRRGGRLETAAQREAGRALDTAAQRETRAAQQEAGRAAVAVGLGGRGSARAAQTLARYAGRRGENAVRGLGRHRADFCWNVLVYRLTDWNVRADWVVGRSLWRHERSSINSQLSISVVECHFTTK